MIPKIVHQTWKNSVVDHWIFHRSQQSIRTFLPDWVYRFWTDEDLDTFLRDSFPQFYGPWKALDKHIKRVDIARYCILYIFGGLYADLDFIFTDRIDDILTDDFTIFSYISTQAIVKNWRFMGNALMMSAPAQDFWLHAIRYMLSLPANTDVLDHTGPRALGHFLRLSESQHKVRLFSPDYFDNERCQDGIGARRYGFHVRTATWQRK